jgi:hypothetical protein
VFGIVDTCLLDRREAGLNVHVSRDVDLLWSPHGAALSRVPAQALACRAALTVEEDEWRNG